MLKTFILLILVSLNVRADNQPDVSTWSLRYLARASNALLVAHDTLLDKKPALCGLKEGEPAVMSQKLKALLDEKISSLSSAQKKKIHSQIPSCQSDCSCDIFSLYTEANPESKIKVPSTDPSHRKVCAESFQEFCSSRLLQHLR